MNQTNGNFAYDLIGNLVKDKAMEVASMSWTAYHKREKVVKEDGTTITYRYDAMNNRIYKKAEGNGVTETTHYLRDGTGNTLAIYKDGKLEELNIYGSSRLGIYNGNTDKGKRTLGNKRYELSNHLGNALVVITDNKIGIDNLNNDLVADTYIAMVVSERDYLAFGAVMHKRSYENEEYTYSFNGKELDKSTGWQDYGFRDYNPVYKRFDRVDPLTVSYPFYSPYQFAGNTPISAVDLDGLEIYFSQSGQHIGSWGTSTELRVINDSRVDDFVRDYNDDLKNPNQDHGSMDFYWPSSTNSRLPTAEDKSNIGVNPVIPTEDFVGWQSTGCTQCFECCKTQVDKQELETGGYWTAIQIWKIGNLGKPVTEDSQREGIALINENLDQGKSIIVGVDYDMKGGNKDDINGDHTTDHFVTIVGRGVDDNGLYFTFYENATSDQTDGTNTTINRFYLNDDYTLTGESTWSSENNRSFTVTMVRPTK